MTSKYFRCPQQCVGSFSRRIRERPNQNKRKCGTWPRWRAADAAMPRWRASGTLARRVCTRRWAAAPREGQDLLEQRPAVQRLPSPMCGPDSSGAQPLEIGQGAVGSDLDDQLQCLLNAGFVDNNFWRRIVRLMNRLVACVIARILFFHLRILISVFRVCSTLVVAATIVKEHVSLGLVISACALAFRALLVSCRTALARLTALGNPKTLRQQLGVVLAGVVDEVVRVVLEVDGRLAHARALGVARRVVLQRIGRDEVNVRQKPVGRRVLPAVVLFVHQGQVHRLLDDLQVVGHVRVVLGRAEILELLLPL
eukprot:m.104667 g.104667  ORF g.104667 m.104667 type:complete len:311 (+) comp8894_c0_seq1:17-949(+)